MKTLQTLANQAAYRNELRKNKEAIIAKANKAWDNRPSNTMWSYTDQLLDQCPFVDYRVEDSVKLSILLG